MQKRQLNRRQYFYELAATSRKYFIPYIHNFKEIKNGTKVLEVGCGDGGNLLPFSEMGAEVVGVDSAVGRIKDARSFFKENGASGTFIASDIFFVENYYRNFDIIVCHDVIEHVQDKKAFLEKLKMFLKQDGIIFMSFPAWQMPFGGHQQICKNKMLSHLPFFHLLPKFIYRGILTINGETHNCIQELLDIKKTKCPIELFEKSVGNVHLWIRKRTLFFINPHYEVKFGLKPKLLPSILGRIPYVRDYFTTSCFYILYA
jgi:SAM-dependent methyltransferase